jgi:hypothetical protein
MPFQCILYAKKSLIKSITDQGNGDQIPMIKTFASVLFAFMFSLAIPAPHALAQDSSWKPESAAAELPTDDPEFSVSPAQEYVAVNYSLDGSANAPGSGLGANAKEIANALNESILARGREGKNENSSSEVYPCR